MGKCKSFPSLFVSIVKASQPIGSCSLFNQGIFGTAAATPGAGTWGDGGTKPKYETQGSEYPGGSGSLTVTAAKNAAGAALAADGVIAVAEVITYKYDKYSIDGIYFLDGTLVMKTATLTAKNTPEVSDFTANADATLKLSEVPATGGEAKDIAKIEFAVTFKAKFVAVAATACGSVYELDGTHTAITGVTVKNAGAADFKDLEVENDIDDESAKSDNIKESYKVENNDIDDLRSSEVQHIVPSSYVLPTNLRIMPMQGRPVFPGIILPVFVTNKEDVSLIKETEKLGDFIGLILTKEQNSEISALDDLYSVGTVAKIHRTIILEDGSLNLLITSIQRFKTLKLLSNEIPMIAEVEYLEDFLGADPDEIKGMTRSLFNELRILADGNPLFTEQMRLEMFSTDQPGRVADIVTSILNIDRESQQSILETLNIRDRMEKTLMLVKKEQELTRIQKRVSKEINERVEKIQREHFLKEELKAIKEELGESTSAKTSDLKRFRAAIENLELSGESKEQIEKEIEKFEILDPLSAEYSVSRNYLETIIALPWNKESEVDINLSKSQKILDEAHYGLEDAKKRIIEFLAVCKLRGHTRGAIICLVGPPGVGKTSIGKSVADAMERKFFRFSVGGMRDEAEIKGHRRTYVSAMPGKIIQGLKISKTRNPVFMIDEIDKLASSYQGDPSSALLEVLDPEQNDSFRDHFLDMPFDLSHVFFIVTANTLDTIPSPLLDRMEIIHLSGYTDQEKVEIAKRYIIPKSLISNGLSNSHILYEDNAVLSLASGYARDAGVRNLEKFINKIHRKIALKVAMGEQLSTPLIIKENMLEEFLKKPPFRKDDTLIITKPGMTIGLAWTSLGGDTLMIESVSLPTTKGPSLHLTGQMGDVMQESANIAYTYAQLVSTQFGAPQDFFENHRVHLHIPAGSTPKDGPSAGITMTTALVSLATAKKVPHGWAMTGELSLTGNVLPIGGLKEKSLAARRANIKNIIIPKGNENDISELGDIITNGITYYPVEHIEEVLKLLF